MGYRPPHPSGAEMTARDGLCFWAGYTVATVIAMLILVWG
jgi:hypothetical protein